MKIMRVWGMLLVVLMSTSLVFAQVDMTFTGVGNWTDPNLWDVNSVPGAVELANYVNIDGPNTICTVNTDTGAFSGGSQRLVVDNGGTLVLEEGGVLAATTWSRIGVSGEGTVIQTGGLFEVQHDNLGIGDKAGGQGYYVMSGGTLTYAGDKGGLGVGHRDGEGTFTVIGTDPNIQLTELNVGERNIAAGTVEFVLDINGVSPIVLSNVANIDKNGDSTTAALVVRASATPPAEDIMLIETTSDANVAGVFDTVNGMPAVEGAEVVVARDGLANTYLLTYVGGTGNDIMLLYQSSTTKPTVVYVTGEPDADGDGVMDDQGWIDWLVEEGYKVDARRRYYQEPLDVNRVAELEAADLIIASRGLGTGDYDATADVAIWNGLSTPLINLNAWLLRNNSKWYWMNSNSAVKDAGSPLMVPLDPNHPIFADVELDQDGLIQVLDPNVGSGHTSFLNDILDVGNGSLLAQSLGTYNTAWIAEWPVGVEFYDGCGQVTGGPRMMYMAGTQDVSSGQGEFNLTPAGEQILRNMIGYLAPDVPYEEPGDL